MSGCTAGSEATRRVSAPHRRLEASYRRVLRLFPTRYRTAWADEMLGVLLATAAPGQRRPHPADLADLVVACLRAWLADLAGRVRRDLPLAIGAVALLVSLTVALLPTGTATADAGTAPAVPDRFAGYFGATGDVSDSPPGRAVALYQHADDSPYQPLVVGADTDSYRRLDLALDRRTGVEPTGEPAPALLAPDGGRVAVGQGLSRRPALVVQDLLTGRTTTYPVGAAGGVLPLAWSATGDRIAYAATPDESPVTYRTRTPTAGRLGLLDLASGRAVELPGNSRVAAAAFAPDGTQLAVQDAAGPDGVGPDGGGVAGLRIVALDGSTVGPVPAAGGERLAGPAAWSPDGRLLAVTSPRPGAYTRFVRPGGAPGSTPAPLTHEGWGTHHVLGWAGPDRVVVARDRQSATTIVQAPLHGGPGRQLSTIPHGAGYPVAGLQLATALLPELRVRPAAAPDRGRWPTWWRVGIALGVTGSSFAAAYLLASRRDRVRRAAQAGAAPAAAAPAAAAPAGAAPAGATQAGAAQAAAARARRAGTK